MLAQLHFVMIYLQREQSKKQTYNVVSKVVNISWLIFLSDNQCRLEIGNISNNILIYSVSPLT